MKICDRIKKHYRRFISYDELMRLVFPEDEYPRAWRYQMNGGPPGCAMAFGKAIKSLGLVRRRISRDVEIISKTKDCKF